MNERIKDMLEQPVFDRLWDWYNIGPVQRATLEEFAELIVRECAGVVFKKVGPKSALDVLEHFGVEE